MTKATLPAKPQAILWRYCKFDCFLLILLAIMKGLVAPLTAYGTQLFVDNATAAYLSSRLNYLSIAIPIFLLAACRFYSSAKDVIEEFLEIHIANRLRAKCNYTYAKKLSRLKYEVFENKDKMNVLSRVSSDPAGKAVSYLLLVVDLLSQILGGIGVMYLLAQVAWWLFLPLTLIFLLILYLDYNSVNGEISQSHAQTEKARYKRYLESLMSGKEAAKELRTGNLKDYLSGQWMRLQTSLQKELYALRIKSLARNHGIVRAIMFFANTFILILFIFWVYIGKMTIGQLVSYKAAIFSVLQLAMWSFPKDISKLISSQIYWKEYAAVLSYPEDTEKEESFSLNSSEETEIEFKDVSFAYPGTDTLILNHFNLKFKLKERIALAGENGCGKSTLIKLLFGLYLPDAGTITADGIDLSRLSFSEKKHLFSPVFQDSARLFLTVKESIGIAYLSQMQNMAAIRSAASHGIFSEYADTLPNQYDTKLGNIYEDGVELSGGQWQRLGISRAYMNPSCMKVLDEPTASLDARAENDLYETILNMQQSGLLIVTHRLGITSHLDRIIVLQDGAVAEDGTHADLMRAQEIYYNMYIHQAGWYAMNSSESEVSK